MTYSDPEAQRAYSRKYQKRHRAAYNENQRRYRARNLEKRRAFDRDASRARLGIQPNRVEPANCEICGVSPSPGKSLCLDHDHLLCCFRGWICSSCNLMLGYAHDSASALRAAADYLERSLDA